MSNPYILKLCEEIKAHMAGYIRKDFPEAMVNSCALNLAHFIQVRASRNRHICQHVVDAAQELLDSMDADVNAFSELEQEMSELQVAIDALRRRLSGERENVPG